jgi:fluoride exporter
MCKLVWIGLGGAIGTLCRYGLSGLDYKFSNGIFPFSTLLINLLGSLAIGFLWGWFERITFSSTIRMTLMVGFLGGFTTFSTFCLENFNLLRDGEYHTAFWNIIVSTFAGIVLVFVGFFLSRFVLHLMRGV